MLRKNKDWRTNILDLINIFNEYRNGNKTVIDKLFTSKDRFNRKGGYIGTNVVILDIGLDNLANSIYYHYQKKAKFTQKNGSISKFSESPYLGTENDVKMEMFIVLREIFDDTCFDPKTSEKIYKEVKNRLQRRLGKIIGKSAFAFSENVVNGNGEEISLLDVVESYGLLSCEPPFIGNELDKNDFKHRHEIAEILNVLKKHDIKTLIRANAHAQMNFIDFLKKNYHLVYLSKEQSVRYPLEKELLKKYCQKYGDISQQRFSAMLRQLFDLLCSCTVTINNNVVTRETYLNYCYFSGKMDYINLTSEETNRLLVLGNRLTDYIPCTIKDDTYFNEVSKTDVMEICRKNKALIKMINDKENLSIEGYTDVLCAVGIMLRDYCRGKVTYQLDRFLLDYSVYRFDISTDKLLNLCMGILPVDKYWRMVKTDNEFSLRTYKKCDDNYFASFTGRNDKVDFESVKCIQVGLGKFFVSDMNKMIYCCSALKELSFTRRVGNKNFGLLAS